MAQEKRAAVLGKPIKHSISPVLHREAYQALGLKHWSYDAVEMDEAGVGEFVESLDESWAGLSLTMPLKHAVVPFLDHVEPLAEILGVVNTVVVQAVREGVAPLKVGANTDVYGIVRSFRDKGLTSGVGEGAPALDAESGAPGVGRRAAILGGGATATSAMAALAQLGYTSPEIYVRSLNRSGALVRAATRMGLSPQWRKFDRAAECVDADVVVSTVPAVGVDKLSAELSARAARPRGVMLDVVYHPWPSALGAVWGDRAIPGTEMLLHQAAEQVRLMTGREAPLAAMRSALDRELQSR